MTSGTRGPAPMRSDGMKKGGKVKKMMRGGSVSGLYGESAAEKQMKAKTAAGGGMDKERSYKSGGKVRGCGMARGGAVRQCKMVKMKGS